MMLKRAEGTAIVIFIFSSILHQSISFRPLFKSYSANNNKLVVRPFTSLLSASFDSDKEEDWRAFRAKLVQDGIATSYDDTPSSWAYDSGLLVEKGSIVLSRVEDSLGCHDLRQPYFCKCVVLIVETDDEFVQGIILNRPSNLNLNDQDIVYLDDDGSQLFLEDQVADNSWRMFFGGDIAGLYDENPLILCLHNHTSELAQSVSDIVLPGVYMTSHLGARALVDAGHPAESFFTFYGFCGWDPNQLEREVERGSWYMVSVDSPTLWKDLQAQRDPTNDPRQVGLDMWQGIINAIGRQDDETAETSAFAELMLKEWAAKMLMVSQDGDDMAEIDDSDIFRALQAAGQPSLNAGSLVRGSSQEESPHLLHNQFLHKSAVLLLQETDQVSIGLVLNLPSTDSYSVEMPDGKSINFPIRYGGPGGNDEDPLIGLHNKDSLKGVKVGQPLGELGDIWTCSLEQIIDSIGSGLAMPNDFLLVQGFCVWEKEEGSGGITGELMAGKFEPVPLENVDQVWSQILSQSVMSKESLDANFHCLLTAWKAGGDDNDGSEADTPGSTDSKCRLVFESDAPVCELANDALKNWIKIFILGNVEYYY